MIDHGWTINKIAERIAKSDSYVSDRVGLIRRLHPDLAKRFSGNGNGNGHLKPSHLELLARIRSKRRQIELSNMVELRRLSVRKLEKMISGGQPFKETIKEHDGSLYVKLPEEIADHVKFEEGDEVFIFPQSRKTIAIERAIVQEPRLIASPPTLLEKRYVTPVPA